jgi:hypothetical protein
MFHRLTKRNRAVIEDIFSYVLNSADLHGCDRNTWERLQRGFSRAMVDDSKDSELFLLACQGKRSSLRYLEVKNDPAQALHDGGHKDRNPIQR